MDTPRIDTPGPDPTQRGVESPFLGSKATSTMPQSSPTPSLSRSNGRSKQILATPELDALAEVVLFRGLTTEQLSKLSTLLGCKRYPARSEIITMSQPGDIAYIILDGSVKIHIDQPDGDVIVAVLGASELVGEMSLVDSLGRSASVSTLEPSTLLLIDRATFTSILQEMPKITYNLINILSRRLRLANVHAQSLSRLDVYGRVAGQLLAFAREYGEVTPNGDVVIPLRLTQSDLAEMVGASRVRVNQALSFYKRRNYLSVNPNRHIVVHNLDALGHRCN